MEMKTCTKCGAPKPATTEFFYAQGNPTAPLRAVCKECMHEATVARVKADPENARAIGRRTYHKHREYYLAKMARWREQNPEKMAESQRRYGREHPEKTKARNANRRAVAYGVDGHLSLANIAAQRTAQNGRCHWCGEKVGRHYHVDHVQPMSKGGTNTSGNIVIACADCNRAKGPNLPEEWASRLT